MRSRQFNDFPSNWSTPLEINLTLVPRPQPPTGYKINLTKVKVVCRNIVTLLELDGEATWDEVVVPQGTMLEYYELSIPEAGQISQHVSCD